MIRTPAIPLISVSVVGLYLIGKYDAGNAGTVVWYVGGLTGEVTIPQNFLGGTQFGLSHWSLYRGEGTTVPEGGSTLALLGLVLLGVHLLRRSANRLSVKA